MARRVLLLSAAALALALPAAPASAACPGADTELTALSLATAPQAVLCLVNEERTARGLNALKQNDQLQLAAQLHTVDMVRRNFFDHVTPDGISPFDRIEDAGYEYSTAGENIAAGYRTPRDVMAGWMESPGHCRNILGGGYTELGVGIDLLAATISRGVGTWTQNFGRPIDVRAPSNPAGVADVCDGGVSIPGSPDDPTGGDGDGAAGETPDLPGAGGRDDEEYADPLAAAPARLTLRLRRSATRLLVRGRLRAADGAKVRIAVRRAGRTVFRTTTRIKRGRYGVRIKTPADAGRLIVVVRVAGQRAARVSAGR